MDHNRLHQVIPASEDMEQATVFDWCRWAEKVHPELQLMHHCPNGGSRNKIEAGKLKRMGVLAGVADIHLPVPRGNYASLYIEMKYANGRLEDSQKRFLLAAAGVGNYCVVCYNADTAVAIISEYIRLQAGESMSVPNASICQNGRIKPIRTQKSRNEL